MTLSKIQGVSLTESEDVAEPGGGGVESVGADGVVDEVVAVVLVPEVGEPGQPVSLEEEQQRKYLFNRVAVLRSDLDLTSN